MAWVTSKHKVFDFLGIFDSLLANMFWYLINYSRHEPDYICELICIFEKQYFLKLNIDFWLIFFSCEMKTVYSHTCRDLMNFDDRLSYAWDDRISLLQVSEVWNLQICSLQSSMQWCELAQI